MRMLTSRQADTANPFPVVRHGPGPILVIVVTGIGSGIDSFYEYLFKAFMLFRDPDAWLMFNEVPVQRPPVPYDHCLDDSW